MLVETYEAQHYSIDESSPSEVLLHIIESSGISKVDLIDIFGSSEILTQVLAGKKAININQANILGDRFQLSPTIFLSIIE
jgi:HTH-type transcriptional regulator / antitoxin HigA